MKRKTQKWTSKALILTMLTGMMFSPQALLGQSEGIPQQERLQQLNYIIQDTENAQAELEQLLHVKCAPCQDIFFKNIV